MAKFCANCGSEIEDSWNTCPNCGTNIKAPQMGGEPQLTPTPSQTPGYGPRPTSNGYGIGALVLSIIGLCCFSYILGPIAIILGAAGISKDDNNGMAIAGLLIGIFDLCCGLISLFFLTPFLYYLL